MDDEQKSEDIQDDVPSDDPFADQQERPVPWFWLGLLLIPILSAFFATISQMNVQETPAEIPIVEEEKETQNTKDRAHLRRRGVQSKRNDYDRCDFSVIMGRKMTQNLYDSLRRTKRLVRMVRDEGQTLPRDFPERITIYLNEKNVITRVVCG